MNSLYKVRENLRADELVNLTINGIEAGEVVWVHGVRHNSHGSYGRISKTYESRPGYRTPYPKIFENIPMRYLEELTPTLTV